MRIAHANPPPDAVADDEHPLPDDQPLTAGVIDELLLDIVPVLLGTGERLFDGVHDLGLDPVEVIASPHATHVRYRITR